MDNQNITDHIANKIFHNKYKAIKKLGEGSFGKVYSCKCLEDNIKYAMKMENKYNSQNLLKSEHDIMRYLAGRKNI